jgi:hypothetical protein
VTPKHTAFYTLNHMTFRWQYSLVNKVTTKRHCQSNDTHNAIFFTFHQGTPRKQYSSHFIKSNPEDSIFCRGWSSAQKRVFFTVNGVTSHSNFLHDQVLPRRQHFSHSNRCFYLDVLKHLRYEIWCKWPYHGYQLLGWYILKRYQLTWCSPLQKSWPWQHFMVC